MHNLNARCCTEDFVVTLDLTRGWIEAKDLQIILTLQPNKGTVYFVNGGNYTGQVSFITAPAPGPMDQCTYNWIDTVDWKRSPEFLGTS